MSTTHPLDLAGRMSRKSAQLFRKINRPGLALFGEIGAEAIGEATRIAGSAARADSVATAIIDEVLADGRVTPAELPKLRRARRQVARSAVFDRQLAGGVA